MAESKDWIAPITMIILSIFMYRITNILQEMVDETNLSNGDHNDNNNNIYYSSKRYDGPSRIDTTIIDNFMNKEDPIMKELENKDLWSQCHDGRPEFWDGKSNPKNIWEELSKKIWEGRPEFKEAVGFEYWCNILPENKMLPWHIDKDEEAYKESFDLVTPMKGAVYYGFDHDGKYEGGKLWLVDAALGDDPTRYENEWRDGLTEIDANYNRVIYFNASLWHKVSDVTSGARYTFAVNALSQIPRRLN